MQGVQCYEIFGGIALRNHAFLIKTYKKDKTVIVVLYWKLLSPLLYFPTLANTYHRTDYMSAFITYKEMPMQLSSILANDNIQS